MPDCPACGANHPPTCGAALGPKLAEHLLDHPEDLTVALLELQIVRLQEQVRELTTEVHQR